MRPARFLSFSPFCAILASVSLLLAVGGCDTKGFVDPTEMGRYKHEPMILPILSQIDPSIEAGSEDFANATDPTPADMKAISGDYRISKNDMVQITISDLQGPGQETVKTTRVSDSGNISLPFINSLHAEGLTEIELEQAIVEAYRNANLIQNAQVSVAVVEARGRTFSILGGVGAPGQYAIVDSDFRILNALVLARDVTPSDIEFLYIVRQNLPPAHGAGAAPGQPPTTTPSTGPAPEDLTPKTEAPTQQKDASASAGPVHVNFLADAPTTEPAADAATPPTTAPGTEAPFEFNEPNAQDATRIIRIPIAALRAGDLKYNIPVQANDLIIVPVPAQGEFYMGGHVQRPGAFTLTDRKITLKEAVVSAGMLDALAIPQRTDIIRRVQPNHEVFVRVDLSKVFAGDQPDIYLKPYDEVMVGTNALAPFIAAFRGAFRITYGFGFLYDQNFSPQGNNNGL